MVADYAAGQGAVACLRYAAQAAPSGTFSLPPQEFAPNEAAKKNYAQVPAPSRLGIHSLPDRYHWMQAGSSEMYPKSTGVVTTGWDWRRNGALRLGRHATPGGRS